MINPNLKKKDERKIKKINLYLINIGIFLHTFFHEFHNRGYKHYPMLSIIASIILINSSASSFVNCLPLNAFIWLISAIHL